ncbi:FusB/FusC family EF-G-binding protein [Ammoniphilus resinae]|uniref:Elongation factor G-binding protein n=1 Tax=Ammoniphilus resinae TaxID=861532 RepID=A0ABS4GLK7_9BACL|nr:FusB/FusC family EF-G-binding protein [Ammoniphilus resinae]MBP1931143.1 hypothetical protein [Ammoniphilus resinae]
MLEPFIMNHQYNMIKKQAGILQHTIKTVGDPQVVEAVRGSAESKVMEMFSDATEKQMKILERFSSLKLAEDFQQYLASLAPYLIEFPQLTEKQIRKQFSKNKKLKVPDLTTIDYHSLTYYSWLDISMNKLFIVYPYHGEIVGIEGKLTPANKKDVCCLCNGFGEVALVSAVSKARIGNSPDYYKAVGNYMCLSSEECNKRITSVANLERFIEKIIG